LGRNPKDDPAAITTGPAIHAGANRVSNNASVRCCGRRSAASWMITAVGLVPGGWLPRWLPGARTAS
jgi:hypothetical protein